MSDLRVVTALDEGGGSWGKAAWKASAPIAQGTVLGVAGYSSQLSFALKGQKNCHRVMFLPMQGVSSYNATSDGWKAEKHKKDEGTKSHDFVPPDLKN